MLTRDNWKKAYQSRVARCGAQLREVISTRPRHGMPVRLPLLLAAKELGRGFILTTIVATLLLFNPSARAMELVGLDHFAINVTDLQRSADWYQRVLGFAILHKWNTTWMVGRDNIKIGLFLRPNAKPTGH
jgi:Glyoxalase/Bleomycin resistance protein/Dioxygenase superfamily